MITIESVVQMVLYLLVIGCVFWLLNWLIGYVGAPDPFAKFARVFLAVCAVLIIISLLLGLIGHPMVRW